MLKTDIKWPNHRRFKSRTEWEPIGFFSDCLCNATHFDLMLGFFSSSAINVLSYGFASFLYNGGKMRLIINNVLTTQDKEAIVNGCRHSIIKTYDLSDIHNIHETLSKRDKHFFECLSYLIRKSRLDVVVIEPKDGLGISHTKTGVFYDNADKVAFDGSCNFSKTALIDNLESLTVSCSWDGAIECAKVEDIENDFARTFAGDNDSVNYLSAEAIKTQIVTTFENRDIADLLKQEYELLSNDIHSYPQTVIDYLERAKYRVSKQIEQATAKRERELEVQYEPRFPYESGPREYQRQAFENWKANGQQGLFAMATGTGKTITSLNCLLEIYKRTGYYKAIILVPTITLVNQWESECRKFNFNPILKVSGSNSEWREELGSIKASEQLDTTGKSVSYVIICTYASFAKPAVFDKLNSLSRNKLLLIADEAHNMGSRQLMKKLGDITYYRRIGLSATPERQYDATGNNAINTFFNSKEGYTYEYSMKEAIENGVLCKYYYYPHVVRLAPSEMDEYIDISQKIARYITYNGGDLDDPNSVLQNLLLARKRIIHKAENKLDAFKAIIDDELKNRGDLKYTLIYVPEGSSPDSYNADIFDDREGLQDDIITDKLIDRYTKIVMESGSTITVQKFTSDSTNRDDILSKFSSGDIQVLTSMKCLDEGVDVPRSELAIFCASTGNPRQFIQRRGRILRQHKDKQFATIHDLVVVPEVSTYSESYTLERNLLKIELRRVRDFAQMSLNASYAQYALRDAMDYYKLNLYNND